MTDPRLDRRVHFDERSRAYPVRALHGNRPPRSYTWRCRTVLDQGREGACTGFAVAAELAARPREIPADEALARRLYHRARQLDPWPGEDYEGSSVLAAVQAAQEQGYFPAYRWAFGADDLASAVSWTGPAVLGIPWYASMYEAPGGRVTVAGQVVGGHAILCRGYDARRREFTLHNSWGPDWGRGGAARIAHDDLARLLADNGEACVPTRR